MHHPSAASHVRQSEGSGREVALRELSRLDRRDFLRGSALTVAGLATLSGVELVRTPPALAQQPVTVFDPVSNFELISAGATPVPGHPSLHVCRHNYRFDYSAAPGSPPGIPPELVATYRLNAGTAYPAAVPGGPAADRLNPVLQPAPFQSPAAVPAGFPPGPDSVPPTSVPGTPLQYLPLACYRLVQQLNQQTFRIYDWCSLYCFPGNFIVITVGGKCLCYLVGTGGGTPPPPPQKNVVDDTPQLAQYWGAIRSGTQHSVGGIYYYTYNSLQGAFSTATWNADLNVPLGTICKVEAFIPGSSQPQFRTARAKYRVSNIGIVGESEVVISQQLATSQWVSLGTFPFRAGNFSVRLTDETGEPTGSRILVADAVRWVSA